MYLHLYKYLFPICNYPLSFYHSVIDDEKTEKTTKKKQILIDTIDDIICFFATKESPPSVERQRVFMQK